MDAIRRVCDDADDFIGRSTFGRIFRLEGCGHVSTHLTLRGSLLIDLAGEGNKKHKISAGDKSWHHDFLHNVSITFRYSSSLLTHVL
jgi:hypothetical protein